MTEKEIFGLIKKYFIEEFEIPEEKITPESSMFVDLELDSIDALDMIIMLEKELKMDVDEEELKGIVTIQDVIDYIVKKI